MDYNVQMVLIIVGYVYLIDSALYPDKRKIEANYKAWIANRNTGGKADFLLDTKKQVSQLAFYLRLFKHFEDDRSNPLIRRRGLYWQYPIPAVDFPAEFEDSGCFQDAVKCIHILHRNLTDKDRGFPSHWWFDKETILFNKKPNATITYKMWDVYKTYANYKEKYYNHDTAAIYYLCWLTELRIMDALFETLHYCDWDLDDEGEFIYMQVLTEYKTLREDGLTFVGKWPDQQFIDENKTEDTWPYRCSHFSFCPDACCGRNRRETPKFPKQFTDFEQSCLEDPRNPCRMQTLNTTCTYNHVRNQDIRQLSQNMFQVDCECPQQGYQYAYYGREGLCMDMDECANNKHNCDQHTEYCINTVGSFSCLCHFGYGRQADGRCSPLKDPGQY